MLLTSGGRESSFVTVHYKPPRTSTKQTSDEVDYPGFKYCDFSHGTFSTLSGPELRRVVAHM
jgi:hypothetical protein